MWVLKLTWLSYQEEIWDLILLNQMSFHRNLYSVVKHGNIDFQKSRILIQKDKL